MPRCPPGLFPPVSTSLRSPPCPSCLVDFHRCLARSCPSPARRLLPGNCASHSSPLLSRTAGGRPGGHSLCSGIAHLAHDDTFLRVRRMRGHLQCVCEEGQWRQGLWPTALSLSLRRHGGQLCVVERAVRRAGEVERRRHEQHEGGQQEELQETRERRHG
ncbi:hypothetical protein FA09DRAFT_268456 [Tilletiopsis washingtonensis]|uniref:Uncharacterized protein n=1 Tax=Tilletiopsis washingtonensis TaxID=58919 RepID=A0A316ZA04_9BASI|nr:hypothetical protein FA09DRAFT_268456 [Tilletiopsis washingtonensis]PWN98530.1 hypothetical protein FA09DRAFT_268456 [Tilletiopsis washingtonensis]